MDEIPTTEMMEVQAVNVIAPFVLCSKLKVLMAQTQGMKFIINVSAMEGKFYRLYKSTAHPHTSI
jgi:NAD(P)-dependent dehydrogenase (short-subunit alcohol dehydrogenase family)